MHAFIHSRTHIHIHAYMHTCMHTCIHAGMHAERHAYVHICIHAYLHVNTAQGKGRTRYTLPGRIAVFRALVQLPGLHATQPPVPPLTCVVCRPWAPRKMRWRCLWGLFWVSGSSQRRSQCRSRVDTLVACRNTGRMLQCSSQVAGRNTGRSCGAACNVAMQVRPHW